MQPGHVSPNENEIRGALYLMKPIPSMGRKVIDHSSDKGVTESLFTDYYFKKGWLCSNIILVSIDKHYASMICRDTLL